MQTLPIFENAPCGKECSRRALHCKSTCREWKIFLLKNGLKLQRRAKLAEIESFRREEHRNLKTTREGERRRKQGGRVRMR